MLIEYVHHFTPFSWRYQARFRIFSGIFRKMIVFYQLRRGCGYKGSCGQSGAQGFGALVIISHRLTTSCRQMSMQT